MRRCRTFIGICREAYSFRQDTKDGARSPRQRDRQWGQKAEDPWSGKTYQGRGGEREATSFEIKQQGDGRWRSECLAAKDNVRSPGKDSSSQRITCRSLAAYSQRLPSGAYSRKKIQRLLHKITGKIICCNKRQQNGTFHPSSFTRSERLLFVCGIILISFPVCLLAPSKISPPYLPEACLFLACVYLPAEGDSADFILLTLPEEKASGQSVMAGAADSWVLSDSGLMRGLAERKECRKIFENKSEIWKACGGSSVVGLAVCAAGSDVVAGGKGAGSDAETFGGMEVAA